MGVVEIDADVKQEEGEEEEDVAANNPEERRIADLLITAVVGTWARQQVAMAQLFPRR